MKHQFSRREFLKMGSQMAVIMGLGASAVPDIALAMEKLATGQVEVLWIQAQCCSGCSISFLDSEAPGPAELLTRYVNMVFHHTLSAASGEKCMEIINTTTKKGSHILIVEGSIPAGMPGACEIGHQYINDVIEKAARSASHVISLGTCAAFGGIPSAEGNPTGAISLPEYLKQKGITTPHLSIPGCPSHPDWLVGSLVHLVKFGMPEVDSMDRPKMYFGITNHHKCPRFFEYERGNFAKKFSDSGCLFELGCLGVVTYADCTIRDRNGGVNNCIKSGAPCIGCTSEIFAKKKALPFYRKTEI